VQVMKRVLFGAVCLVALCGSVRAEQASDAAVKAACIKAGPDACKRAAELMSAAKSSAGNTGTLTDLMPGLNDVKAVAGVKIQLEMACELRKEMCAEASVASAIWDFAYARTMAGKGAQGSGAGADPVKPK
jgi:hypothetical protein